MGSERKYDQRRMDSIYRHFDNLRNFAHYERTDKRKEVKKMKTSSKRHKVEKILTDIVRKINTRLEHGETITEIVGAYYNYNNLVDLLCGIYNLTFEETKEVMEQWSFDSQFGD
jgi:hypothetical protein|nr:MAG TPA: hypothetical protein [Caudoviricetes sp.]